MAFGSQEYYHHQRLLKLGVVNPRTGNAEATETAAKTTITIKEYRFFSLYFEWNKTLLLSNPFREALDNLHKDGPTEDEWIQFFDKWGTHVVIQAYGGGAVRITSKSTAASTDQDALSSGSSPTITVNVSGGDEVHYINSLEMLDPTSSWRISIPTKPAMLENDMKLVPLCVFIEQYSAYTSLAKPMEAAMNAYIGGTVVTDQDPTIQWKTKPSNNIPTTREDATKQTSPESYYTLLGIGSTVAGIIPTTFGAILDSPVMRGALPWVATTLATMPSLPVLCITIGSTIIVAGSGIFLTAIIMPKMNLKKIVDKMTEFSSDLAT